MKKVESVLDGSLGRGKTRTLATFPQVLFCLLSLILPKIFTIQGGEGGASASHPHVEALSRRLIRNYLTLQITIKGGMMNRKKILSTVFVFMFLMVSFWLRAEESKSTPVAVSPGSDTEAVSVWQICPTFSWSAVDQASSYRIAVFEVIDPKVLTYEEMAVMAQPLIINYIPGPALSWTLSSEKSLKTGSIYTWYVQAVDANGNALGNWSNGKIFKVDQEIRFAGLEEKLAEKMREYGVNEETINNVLTDIKSEVKEIVVRGSSSNDISNNNRNRSGVLGYEGDTRTFYGHLAGYSNPSGIFNTFIGSQAGYSDTTGYFNTFIGGLAGKNNNANDNTFIGYSAGYFTTTGEFNTFLGYYAGYYNNTGRYNAFLGLLAGYQNTTGYNNTFLGGSAGYNNNIGYNNTLIGQSAGYNGTTGIGNVFLGYNAGYNEIGSNKLYIANSNTSSPLIYGEFDNKIVTINGKLGIGTTTPLGSFEIEKTGSNAIFIFERTDGAQGKFTARAGEVYIGSGSNHRVQFISNNNVVMTLTPARYVGIGINTPSYPLHMSSGAYCSTGGTWTNASSRSLKENIQSLSSDEAMDALNKLNPVKYNYKVDETDRHVGFIAEDVPDLVATADRKGLSPMDITAVLTRVVQEQQKMICEQQQVNRECKKISNRSGY
jgi:hypothetical protein